VKLGYPGWKEFVVLTASIVLGSAALLPLVLVLRLPPDLPLWLFGAAIVLAGAALFASIIVCNALVTWLVPADRLPKEYQ
jgi:hypothetical protein